MSAFWSRWISEQETEKGTGKEWKCDILKWLSISSVISLWDVIQIGKDRNSSFFPPGPSLVVRLRTKSSPVNTETNPITIRDDVTEARNICVALLVSWRGIPEKLKKIPRKEISTAASSLLPKSFSSSFLFVSSTFSYFFQSHFFSLSLSWSRSPLTCYLPCYQWLSICPCSVCDVACLSFVFS